MRDLFYNALLPLGTRLSLAQLHALGAGLGRLLWVALPRRRRETIACVQERPGSALGRGSAAGAGQLHQYRRCVPGNFSYPPGGTAFSAGVNGIRKPRPLCPHVTDIPARGGHDGASGQLGTSGGHDWRLFLQVQLSGGGPSAQGQGAGRTDRAHAFPAQDPHPAPSGRGYADPQPSAGRWSRCLSGGSQLQQGRGGVPPFLGKIAAVNKGPAILALRAKAEVWPVFLLRLPHGRFRMVTLPPLDTRSLSGDRGNGSEGFAVFIPRQSNPWFSGIRSSGSGCTGAGKPAPESHPTVSEVKPCP